MVLSDGDAFAILLGIPFPMSVAILVTFIIVKATEDRMTNDKRKNKIPHTGHQKQLP